MVVMLNNQPISRRQQQQSMKNLSRRNTILIALKNLKKNVEKILQKGWLRVKHDDEEINKYILKREKLSQKKSCQLKNRRLKKTIKYC